MNIRENEGITLIMLIVTMIVILILVSVSISAITGGEGIIEKGKQAKDETEIKAEMEELQKIINQSAAKGIRHGNYSGSADSQTIRDALKKNKLIEENPDDAIIDGKNYWKVTGIKTGQKYKIKAGGTVEKYKGLLPEDFQQVEYLESTGKQWIDTGIIPTNKLKLEIQVQVITNLNQYKTAILGSYGSGYALLCTNSNINGWIIQWGIPFSDYNNKDNLKHNHYVDILNKKYKIDDNEYDINFTVYEKPNNNSIYVFGANNNNAERRTAMKLWYFIIYDENNDIVRNFIPCYATTTVTNAEGNQVPENTKGLYDLVEGKFYTNKNASGDDFIPGPEI
ncbi:MAG: hypothetical protein IKF38_07040 [Clostridia bacterium]|nr:hypothetical protein [Clostridia bacterium]